MTNEYAKITMLGTGNAMCVRCYNTCFCLHSPQSLLMVDAGGGNGIFRQLHRARIPFEDIHHLFVTHTHTDHIMGVVWMIRKISPLIHKGKYQPPFTIYCHDEAHNCGVMLCQSLFEWVMENLTKNAVDAMDGEGRLDITVEDSPNNVVILVKDTGKGIPRKNFKNVFNPGFTTKKRGWGLGLTLVKRIIEEYHNGQIYIQESEVGKGTTFCIELPKVKS